MVDFIITSTVKRVRLYEYVIIFKWIPIKNIAEMVVPPFQKNEQTSKTMSAIKAKNTKPELLLRHALWHAGIRGYRLHWKKAPGRPDIAFPGKKIAIFVNGCFWHRCPHCNPSTPKSNVKFWDDKFNKNVERNKRKIELLEKDGWRVLTIWECQLKKDSQMFVSIMQQILQEQT